MTFVEKIRSTVARGSAIETDIFRDGCRELEALETELSVLFPDDFRTFLSCFPFGITFEGFKIDVLTSVLEEHRSCDLMFLSSRQRSGSGVLELTRFFWNGTTLPSQIARQYVAIGETFEGMPFLLKCNSDESNGVYFCDIWGVGSVLEDQERNIYKIAPSFEQFVMDWPPDAS